eukprot:9481168-Pyramimonas_sp.AAC.3
MTKLVKPRAPRGLVGSCANLLPSQLLKLTTCQVDRMGDQADVGSPEPPSRPLRGLETAGGRPVARGGSAIDVLDSPAKTELDLDSTPEPEPKTSPEQSRPGPVDSPAEIIAVDSSLEPEPIPSPEQSIPYHSISAAAAHTRPQEASDEHDGVSGAAALDDCVPEAA